MSTTLTQRIAALKDSLKTMEPLHRQAASTHGHVFFNLECQSDPNTYYWDGLKRGGDPEHPSVIFQYTLEGSGRYEDTRGAHDVPPGYAFMSVVPSQHRYYFPEGKEPWTFFWLSITHPYIVSRIKKHVASAGALWCIDPDSPLITRVVRLIEGISHDRFADTFACERAMFDFMIEYERFGHQLMHPQDQRESLLSEVRRHIIKNIRRPLSIEELAATKGMSRTHFTHVFRRKTGLSPGSFAVDVRLEEAARRLLQTDQNLYAIARETGFADANHLCKVFRRKYHQTPGVFRRQMR